MPDYGAIRQFFTDSPLSRRSLHIFVLSGTILSWSTAKAKKSWRLAQKCAVTAWKRGICEQTVEWHRNRAYLAESGPQQYNSHRPISYQSLAGSLRILKKSEFLQLIISFCHYFWCQNQDLWHKMSGKNTHICIFYFWLKNKWVWAEKIGNRSDASLKFW